ncbi:hypothetical protein BDZ94DRAFT_1256774 [Collybia nuda]|uniref:Uncharacterized protein n=1 Tax=Collybia nuda TaxID=64659 RepID=A0A9P5Y9H7_9AGAR|nr:hypothetical protein BDZ94DRAFT_1256774 [Collybia nuda]
MVHAHVPPDIIYSIIDELGSDKPALQHCSLVSRSFLPPCRSHLFSNIVLSHPKPCRGLYRALNNNPSLACYVRDLSVISGVQAEFRGRDWVTIENTLPDVLQILHELRSFTFRNIYPRALSWDILPLELRNGILELSFSPINAITLDHLSNLPISDFARFIHLKTLRWINIHLDQEHYANARKSLTNSMGLYKSRPWGKGHLASLEIRGSARSGHLLVDALRHTYSPLQLNQLRELSLDGNCAFAAEVTETAAQSLERLSWERLGADNEGLYASSPIIVGVLRTITLSTKFARDKPSDPLPSLVAALRAVSLTDRSVLENLFILLDFTGVWKFSVTARDVEEICEYPIWRELDTVLTSGVFTRLRIVRIILKVSDGLGEFKPLVTRQMPMLATMGVLWVT